MGRNAVSEIDLIEELRLRRWARENYVTEENREPAWHPIVLEEMNSKDREVVPRYVTSEA